MAKNIVFCADGTWNGPGKDEDRDGVPDATNVLRLFVGLAGQVTAESVRQQDEQEKQALAADGSVAQVAKYLHGVGDSRNPIKRLLGGVFGDGFVMRIVRGYTFVSRHYQPGDRIVLVGFSRGAYTARALGGMIARMGLLDAASMQDDEGRYDAERAYRAGIYVWRQHRQLAGKKSTVLGRFLEIARREVDLDKLVKPVPIKAIAVWDTVGALGIPVYSLEDRERMDLYAFADTALSPQVEIGLHAIAIDEERSDFVPTLWDDRAGVEQVWFAGAHADVGGGYEEEALSCLSLGWMARRLEAAGVLFDPAFQPKPAGRYVPGNMPWKEPPFNVFPSMPREHPATARFHRSVQLRLTDYAPYQPASLQRFLEGRALPASQLVD